MDDEKEQTYFDNYKPSDIENVIERQKKIINYVKSKKIKKLHSILIVIDDHADDPKFVRYSKLLHGFFTRGRHDAVSVICSTQKYNVLAPIIRLNASSLYILRGGPPQRGYFPCETSVFPNWGVVCSYVCVYPLTAICAATLAS